jgi:hypothetical protein
LIRLFNIIRMPSILTTKESVLYKLKHYCCILNELEFAITPDVSNPDMYKGWSCKLSPQRALAIWTLAKGRSPKDEFVRKAKVRPKGESPSSGGRPLADIQHRDIF